MRKNRASALASAQVSRRILLTNNPDPTAISDTTIYLPLNTLSPLAYARKVSATSLQTPTPPAFLFQHASLPPLNQRIWNSAYAKEYLLGS
eukprot:12628947-Ditylum_brightwellii.AAC.1